MAPLYLLKEKIMKNTILFLTLLACTMVYGQQVQVGDGLSQNVYSGAMMDSPNRQLSIPAGRWLSIDPAHFGWNQYAYPLNPNNFTDTSGLKDLEGSSGMWDLSGWGPEFGSDILGAQVFFNMDPLTQNYQPDDPANSLPDPGATSPEATSITVNSAGDILGSAGDSEDMQLMGFNSITSIFKNLFAKLCIFCGSNDNESVGQDPFPPMLLGSFSGNMQTDAVNLVKDPRAQWIVAVAAGGMMGGASANYYPLGNYMSTVSQFNLTSYISPTSQTAMEEFGSVAPEYAEAAVATTPAWLTFLSYIIPGKSPGIDPNFQQQVRNALDSKP